MSHGLKSIMDLVNQFVEANNAEKQSDEKSERENRRAEREKLENEKKQNIVFFTPNMDECKRSNPLLKHFSEISKIDFDKDYLARIQKSLILIMNTESANEVKFLKKYQLNNELNSIKEKYIQKLSRDGIPSGTTFFKTYEGTWDDEDMVEGYIDELNKYFDEQIENLKDELETIYGRLSESYLNPDNYMKDKAIQISNNLAQELNKIWDKELFSSSEQTNEIDFERIMQVNAISSLLMTKVEFNEYENFFNQWFSKTTLPEKQISEFCYSGRQGVKEIVEISRDRFIDEINKCIFPLNLYLSDFTKQLAEMCMEQ